MTVYAVALLKIHDREGYGAYEQGFMEIFSKSPGRVLAVEEAPTIMEGEWPWTRTVLLEFPDQQSLDAWYASSDYQALAQHRFRASEGAVALLKAMG
jgi:uncharacterized protein (DUF1330 family)